MKADNVRDLNADDITAKLEETREELFNLRFQRATGALENTSRIAAVRRDVARLLTIERERAKESDGG